jgi:hypothetical protein
VRREGVFLAELVGVFVVELVGVFVVELVGVFLGTVIGITIAFQSCARPASCPIRWGAHIPATISTRGL